MYILSSLMNNITFHVSNWSTCMDISDQYKRYRNITIYQNGVYIFNTYGLHSTYLSLFNIEELCDKDIVPYVAIIFVFIMICLCLLGCKCMGKCPQDKIIPF